MAENQYYGTGRRKSSAAIVLATAVVSAIVAMVIHRMGILLIRRIARGHPFTTACTYAGFRPSQLVFILFSLRLVLTGAPNDTPALIPLAHLTTKVFNSIK